MPKKPRQISRSAEAVISRRRDGITSNLPLAAQTSCFPMDIWRTIFRMISDSEAHRLATLSKSMFALCLETHASGTVTCQPNFLNLLEMLGWHSVSLRHVRFYGGYWRRLPLNRFSSLRSVILIDVSEDQRADLLSISTLRELTLIGAAHPITDLTVLTQLNSLSLLDDSSKYLSPFFLSCVASVLRSISNLTSLDLHVAADLRPNCDLLQSIGKNKNLQHLRLWLNDSQGLRLFEPGTLTQLQSLTLLDHFDLREATFPELSKLHINYIHSDLPPLPKLTKLECAGPISRVPTLTTLTSLLRLVLLESASSFEMAMLGRLHLLQKLYLPIARPHLYSFASLRSLDQLRTLYIEAEGRPFPENLLESLPSSLTRLRTLRVTCPTSQEGLMILGLEAQDQPFTISSLRALTALEILEITKAPVPLQQMIDLTQSLTRLKELNLFLPLSLLLDSLPFDHLPLLYQVNEAGCEKLAEARRKKREAEQVVAL